MTHRLTWGIDPGPTHGAAIAIDDAGKIYHAGMMAMGAMATLPTLHTVSPEDTWAIEWLSSYGAPLGAATLETAYWVGHVSAVWAWSKDLQVELWSRRTIKVQLLGGSRGSDKDVRQSLLRAFQSHPRAGGGRNPAVGTKARPGPLYGVSGHLWSALAVAVVAQKARAEGRLPDALVRRGELERNPLRR